MTHEDDLDNILEDLQKKAYNLRRDNSRIMGRLERRGISPEITLARIEHLLKWMVKIDLLSEQDLWKMNLDWELDLNNQLCKIEARIIEAEATMRERKKHRPVTVVRSPLLGPDGKPII